jgi:hypothetical protein
MQSIMLDYHQVQHDRFQVLSTMSSYSLPEFKFPKTMFISKYDLPNESHPWFTEFKLSAEESVFHPVTQEAMEYSASLSILKGLRELVRETMLTEYHDVYSVIKKFKVIREANRLRKGIFSFYEPEQSNLEKFFPSEQSNKAGPSVFRKDKKSSRKGKGKAKRAQEDMGDIATQELDSMLNFSKFLL